MRILKDKKKILLYVLNPVVIFVSSILGQFDPIVIFFLLLAYISFINKSSIIKTGLLLSASICFKTYAILLFPFFFLNIKNIRNRIIFTIATLIPFLMIILPFIFSDFNSINKTFFTYTGAADYGWLASFKAMSALIGKTSINFSPINYLLPILLTISKYIFIPSYFLLIFWLIRLKKNLLIGINLVFLLFFIIHGGIGTNFLFWVIAFLMLYDSNLVKTYTFFGFPAVIFYVLGQFYEPVLKHYNFLLFKTPTVVNLFYFITTLVFWLYLVGLFFNLLTQKNSKANLGKR